MEMKEINLLIEKYSIELNNLKKNRSNECDTLSDADSQYYDSQIELTARIVRDLKRLKEIMD